MEAGGNKWVVSKAGERAPDGVLPALTSLRFFAAGSIVFFHYCSFTWTRDQISPVWALGVSFYFVLSGFILTYNYGERNGNWTGAYYWARFARIWPMHAATFLLAVLSFPGAFDFAMTSTGSAIALANLVLIHAWVPNLSWVFSFNSVSWSLSAEAFFYLLFPLVCRSRRPVTVYLASLLLAVSCVAMVGRLVTGSADQSLISGPAFWYMNPFVRVPEFLLGVVAARMFSRDANVSGVIAWSVLEIVAVGLVVLFAWSTSPFRPWMAGMDGDGLRAWLSQSGGMIVFAPLIFVFARGAGLISRTLAWRPFILLGDISFATFMIHQPIFRYFFSGIAPGKAPILLTIYATSMVYGGSYVLWRYLETPCRRWLLSARADAVLRRAVFWGGNTGLEEQSKTG